jgi:hypothetical protein
MSDRDKAVEILALRHRFGRDVRAWAAGEEIAVPAKHRVWAYQQPHSA